MSQSHGDSSTPIPPEPKKRKPTETRSRVWDHFEKIYSPEGKLVQASCKYCGKLYKAEPERHGTSSMKNHSDACLQNPHAKETRQSRLAFSTTSDNESVLTNWVFKQENVRKATARMIIIDELPLRFVEGRGFRQWVQEACPMFKIPSR